MPGGNVWLRFRHRPSSCALNQIYCAKLFVCVVCWWGVLGVTDGAAWRLFCSSVQLLPHPRELRTEGEYSTGTLKWANLSYNCTIFCSLRFTTWPSPLSWCKMEAWRSQKPDQKVVKHLLKNYLIRKKYKTSAECLKKKMELSYLRLTSRWKPLLTMLEAFRLPLWSTFSIIQWSWFSQSLKNYCLYIIF